MPDKKPTDNEIINECPFKEQIENYKEEIKEFFSQYENKSGCEDRIEVCLIRAGYRTVLKAEEEITRLQADNIALNRRAIPSSGHILKVGNALLFAENKEDYDITINAIKTEAYKEFAEKADEILKRYSHLHKYADKARHNTEEYADGTPMEMVSVWEVLSLKKWGMCDYETMNTLEDNIETIAKERLLTELEKDLRLLKKEMEGK